MSEEVIENRDNGLLIKDPLDIQEIANSIEWSILNSAVRAKAQAYNVDLIQKEYNRIILKKKIVALYQKVYLKAD